RQVESIDTTVKLDFTADKLILNDLIQHIYSPNGLLTLDGISRHRRLQFWRDDSFASLLYREQDTEKVLLPVINMLTDSRSEALARFEKIISLNEQFLARPVHEQF